MDYDSTALPTELPRPGCRGVGYTSGRGDLSSAAMHSLSGGSALNIWRERLELHCDELSVHREVIVVVIQADKGAITDSAYSFRNDTIADFRLTVVILHNINELTCFHHSSTPFTAQQ